MAVREAERSSARPPADPAARRRRLARAICTPLYLAIFVAYWVFFGLPTDPIQIFLWLWAGTIAWNAGAPWRTHLVFLRDWSWIIVVLVAYNFTRGVADNLGTPLHVTEPIHFDEWLFGGTLPTIWLQDHLCGLACTPHTPARWYDVIASFVYFSHFVASLILAAVLWVRSRRAWQRFMSRFMALTIVGLIIYVVYPMAPPWWAGVHGYLPEIPRITDRGWNLLGLHSAAKIVVKGQAVSNPVAAMPSLHAAFALLVAWFLILQLRRTWRFLLLLYPLVMGTTLVYLGEHYVLDVLCGFACTAVVMVGVGRAERWWLLRRPVRAGGVPSGTARTSVDQAG